MTQMLAQRERDYFAETVICANCFIVAIIFLRSLFVFVRSLFDFLRPLFDFVRSLFVFVRPLFDFLKST